MSVCLVGEDFQQAVDVLCDHAASLSCPKTHVGRDLVVPAAGGVQASAGITDGLGQGGPDVVELVDPDPLGSLPVPEGVRSSGRGA